MSVIPLSATDRSSGEGASEPVERPGTFDHNGAATKAVDEAVDKLFAHEEVEQERDLDKLISKNVDKWQADRDEETSFAASRESREALQTRYSDHGDLGQTLDAYIGWAKRFRDNPREAGLAFAESYALASPYGLKEHKPKEKVETYVDEGGKRYSGAKLSSIIEDAMDNASSEKKAFSATAKQRQALKEIFPNKSFDEAIATIVKIDSDAVRDPAGTAATIAAGFGMNWLPGQPDHAAERQNANAQVAHAAQVLPGFEQLRVPMAHIIESGQANNLQDAYQIAAYQQQEQSRAHNWVRSQLEQLVQVNPDLAWSVAKTMKEDAAFAKYAGNADPATKFNAAITWVKSKAAASNKRSVERARKATPVKSSSGAMPGGARGKGLDAHLNAALAGWRD